MKNLINIAIFLVFYIFGICSNSKHLAANIGDNGIIIQTDSFSYKLGETIIFTITNNFNEAIWYLSAYETPTSSADKSESQSDTAERHIEDKPEMGSFWYLYFPPYPSGNLTLKPLYKKLDPKETAALNLKFTRFWNKPVKDPLPSKYRIVIFISFEKPGNSIMINRFYSNEIEIVEDKNLP